MCTPAGDIALSDLAALTRGGGVWQALLQLFDRLPGVVFFAKDAQGRYLTVNATLLQRLGRRSPAEVLGRTAAELFAPPLGQRYLAQDLEVCRSGRALEDVLELHLYPDGGEGWCLTTKVPLAKEGGRVPGLVGVSRDVPAPAAGESPEALARALDVLRARCSEGLRVRELAELAHLSPYRFTRRVRALFGLTPAQLLVKTRIDRARALLAAGEASLAEIAAACGYCDQSAFTRQFRKVVGLTPAQYRAGRRGPV